MQLDQDDTHQQRLKVCSKASGIIGNVGGSFDIPSAGAKLLLCVVTFSPGTTEGERLV